MCATFISLCVFRIKEPDTNEDNNPCHLASQNASVSVSKFCLQNSFKTAILNSPASQTIPAMALDKLYPFPLYRD